tara:strand:+ start:7165 stop:7617 length:453 start_codon:yes stop_codon:yes gene_type:complete
MSLETEIQKLTKALDANTAALLSTGGTIQTTTEEVVKKVETKKPKAEKPETKKPKAEKPETKEVEAIEPAVEATEPAVEDEPEAPTVSVDDLRKVAGKLVEDGKKADFAKVLKSFEAKNLTIFSNEGGDMQAMLEALEAEAGCKLAEIAD